MKPLRCLALGSAFMLTGFAGLAVPAARAAFTLDVAEVGGDVAFTGTGTLDLGALTLLNSTDNAAGLFLADGAVIGVGSFNAASDYGQISGPTSLGSNDNVVFADTNTGPGLGLNGSSGILAVPTGYVSGTALESTRTFDDTTLADLGLSAGTYVYTWGAGTPDADSFTIVVVPEPSTWAMLGVGAVGAGIVTLRRRRASI